MAEDQALLGRRLLTRTRPSTLQPQALLSVRTGASISELPFCRRETVTPKAVLVILQTLMFCRWTHKVGTTSSDCDRVPEADHKNRRHRQLISLRVGRHFSDGPEEREYKFAPQAKPSYPTKRYLYNEYEQSQAINHEEQEFENYSNSPLTPRSVTCEMRQLSSGPRTSPQWPQPGPSCASI